MDYSFSINLHDNEGDVYDECILAHIGKDTIIKFKNVVELEEFAKRILGSIKEIKESEVYRGKEHGGES
jgi:hypothetical protein